MRICGNPILKTLLITAFCMAFLGFSGVHSLAQLPPPPSITAQPSGITVSLLGTGTFSARSKRGTSYQWLMNGQPISAVSVQAPYILDLSQTTSTVVILGATNTASYSLKVSNLGGSVTSSPAILTVTGLSTVVSNVVSFVSSTTGKLANGAFKLTLNVPVGSNIVVEATSDLVGWTPISTNTATSSSMTFTDAAAATISCRFYRAKIQ
jgi:hypothetical protein